MLTQNQFSQGSNLPEGKKKLRWFVALSTLPLLGVVTAFGLVPQNDFDLTSTMFEVRDIALPRVNTNETPVASYWRDERVQRGDTVDELLRRLNVEDPFASQYLRKSADTESFRKLAVGTEVQAETTDSGLLISPERTNKRCSNCAGSDLVWRIPPCLSIMICVLSLLR